MAVYLGNELVLANGVGGTSLANGHASTHAKGGSDELAPADIGAAEEVHTHTEYVLKPVSMTNPRTTPCPSCGSWKPPTPTSPPSPPPRTWARPKS